MKRVKIRKAAERVKRDIRQFWAVGVAFAIYSVIVRSVFGAFCPFLIVTGFPCAGCGLTRAGLHLLRGNFSQAAALNPSIFIVALFMLYCVYFRYLKGTKITGFSFVLGVLVVVTLVVYIYRMHLYFPNKVPYVYYKRNLLTEIFPWYERLLNRVM
ncbi:MAG: DUF2752 domain-containing protein [Lachnospiraceae bacterium]|nr:DUF2752 domain-containing protein [Lachnospiraceae bacterium]